MHVEFGTDNGRVYALNSIDLTINPSEIVGWVGETGFGKPVLATAIMNAVRAPGRIRRGAVGRRLTPARTPGSDCAIHGRRPVVIVGGERA